MIELDRAAAERLKALLTAEGAEILDDPQRLRGLIADRLSRHKRERQALTAALAASVPQRLRSRQAEMVDDRFRADLSVELQERGHLDPATADWAVSAWAVALGLAETITASGPSENSGGKPRKPRTRRSRKSPRATPKPPVTQDDPKQTGTERGWEWGWLGRGLMGVAYALVPAVVAAGVLSIISDDIHAWPALVVIALGFIAGTVGLLGGD